MTAIASAEQTQALPRRTWHYLAPPMVFEVAPCSCGNHETQWSEFAKHLWCAKCEKDFIPEHNGVFDGPIPTKLAQMMGMSFDRFNMETQQVERFNADTVAYEVDAEATAQVLQASGATPT